MGRATGNAAVQSAQNEERYGGGVGRAATGTHEAACGGCGSSISFHQQNLPLFADGNHLNRPASFPSQLLKLLLPETLAGVGKRTQQAIYRRLKTFIRADRRSRPFVPRTYIAHTMAQCAPAEEGAKASAPLLLPSTSACAPQSHMVRSLGTLALGQVITFFTAGTGICSTYLAQAGVSMHPRSATEKSGAMLDPCLHR